MAPRTIERPAGLRLGCSARASARPSTRPPAAPKPLWPRNARVVKREALGAATREEELVVHYALEILRAVDSRCRPTAVLDPLGAVAVIGHLQFALRHVDRSGAAAVMVRRFVDNLAGAFAEYPAVTEVIRRGWSE